MGTNDTTALNNAFFTHAILHPIYSTKLSSVFLFLLLITVSNTVHATSPNQARTLIIDKTQQLVSKLKNNRHLIKDSHSIAYDISNETVVPHIDFNIVSRKALGKYWKTSTYEQRANFSKAFRAYIITTYVSAMIKYTDEIISHAESITYPPILTKNYRKKIVVPTRIQLFKGPIVEVSYKMYLNDNKWMIYDVIIENISLTLTHRSSLYSTIEKHGLDYLIDQLNKHSTGIDF